MSLEFKRNGRRVSQREFIKGIEDDIKAEIEKVAKKEARRRQGGVTPFGGEVRPLFGEARPLFGAVRPLTGGPVRPLTAESEVELPEDEA